jgi:hypothetical protein
MNSGQQPSLFRRAEVIGLGRTLADLHSMWIGYASLDTQACRWKKES